MVWQATMIQAFAVMLHERIIFKKRSINLQNSVKHMLIMRFSELIVDTVKHDQLLK